MRRDTATADTGLISVDVALDVAPARRCAATSATLSRLDARASTSPMIEIDPQRRLTIKGILLLPSIVALLSGCSGASRAQKRAYRAEEAVSKERLRLIEDCQRCMRKADGGPIREDGCETYLRSAEALK